MGHHRPSLLSSQHNSVLRVLHPNIWTQTRLCRLGISLTSGYTNSRSKSSLPALSSRDFRGSKRVSLLCAVSMSRFKWPSIASQIKHIKYHFTLTLEMGVAEESSSLFMRFEWCLSEEGGARPNPNRKQSLQKLNSGLGPSGAPQP